MHSRRQFLRVSALGALASLVPLPKRMGGAALALPGALSAHDELAELIASTERERVLERVAEELAAGARSEQVLAAVLAAGTRHVVPRTDFSKEHHVLLFVQAMQRAEQRVPARLRELPALWAVDYFKEAQASAREAKVEPLEELPPDRLGAHDAESAAAAFRDAMESFDGARAEAAIVALYRTGDRRRLVESLLLYGSRDLRHIGHKAIHVATGLAALELGQPTRAEPVLRSMALTLALHYDEPGHDHDGSYRHNLRAREALDRAVQGGQPSREAVLKLLATLRQASAIDAADEVVAWLQRGAPTQSIWDAMFLSGAELVLNNPTSVEALHAVTASNAAFAAFTRSKRDDTRRFLLLQNASRVADFHRYVAHWAERRKRPSPLSVHLDELAPLTPSGSAAESLDDIFADVGGVPEARLRGAEKVLHYLANTPGGARALELRALEMSLSRGLDTHDFKLPAAVFEDATRVSPRYRALYLAAASARFRGTAEATTPLWGRLVAARGVRFGDHGHQHPGRVR